MKIAILGTGAYGMALASIFYENNNKVVMWTNSEEGKELLCRERKSDKIDFDIPDDIVITTKMKDLVEDANIIVIAVPTKFVRDVSLELKEYYKNEQVICIASKGIEQNSCEFLYDIVKSNIKTDKIVVISGGTFAIDIVKRNPVGLAAATRSSMALDLVTETMQNDYVKLRPTKDVIGVEICGAIKNVIAIASGMLDGMGYSQSTSAMFITESLHDIKSLIKALGGNPKTILSFAGFADLLLTCTSYKSRNYTLGKMIGEKRSSKEINDYKEKTTIEGLYTLEAISKLLKNKKIKMPIINLVYDIVIKGKDAESLNKFLIEKD